MRNLAIIAVALLLVGCGKPEDKFVGMWDGKVEIPPEAVAAMNKMMDDMAKATGQKVTDADRKEMEKALNGAKDVKPTLDLKEDGTCVLSSEGAGRSETANGKWQLSEDKKSITVTVQSTAASAAAPMNQDIVFIIGDDGKTMTFEDNQMGMKTKLTFTKR
jgi:hypothetical protein